MRHVSYSYYKGYFGYMEQQYRNACGLYKGQVCGFKPPLTFQGDGEANEAFQQTVDDYLAECRIKNIEPQKGHATKPIVDMKTNEELYILLEPIFDMTLNKELWRWKISTKNFKNNFVTISFSRNCNSYQEAAAEAFECWNAIKVSELPSNENSYKKIEHVNLDDLPLSSGLKNCLQRFFLENPSVLDIQEATREQLLRTRNMGEKRLAELIKALEEVNINTDWLKEG